MVEAFLTNKFIDMMQKLNTVYESVIHFYNIDPWQQLRAKICLNDVSCKAGFKLMAIFKNTGFFFFFFHVSHEPMFWNLRTKPEKCSRLCSAWSFNLFGWQATFQFRALGKKIYSNFSKPGLVFPNWKNKNLVRGSPTLRRRVSVRYY